MRFITAAISIGCLSSVARAAADPEQAAQEAAPPAGPGFGGMQEPPQVGRVQFLNAPVELTDRQRQERRRLHRQLQMTRTYGIGPAPNAMSRMLANLRLMNCDSITDDSVISDIFKLKKHKEPKVPYQFLTKGDCEYLRRFNDSAVFKVEIVRRSWIAEMNMWRFKVKAVLVRPGRSRFMLSDEVKSELVTSRDGLRDTFDFYTRGPQTTEWYIKDPVFGINDAQGRWNLEEEEFVRVCEATYKPVDFWDDCFRPSYDPLDKFAQDMLVDADTWQPYESVRSRFGW